MTKLAERLKTAVAVIKDTYFIMDGVRHAIWPTDIATAARMTMRRLSLLMHQSLKPTEQEIHNLSDALGITYEWLKTGNKERHLKSEWPAGARLAARARVAHSLAELDRLAAIEE